MARRTNTIFSRLLSYFLLVMAIPLAILIIAYLSYAEGHITKIIETQAISAVESDVRNINTLFLEYKHKAFALASDKGIIDMLRNDKTTPAESKSVYNTIFSEMGSKASNAQAHIISASGKIQLSTHIFPSEYDVRINNNEWDRANILSRAMAENSKESQIETIISIQDHRTTESGKLIFATILRRVFDADGTIVGYVIIELYSDMLQGIIDTSALFNEELLVDSSTYYAISLIHPNIHASLDRFTLNKEDLLVIEQDIPDSDYSIIVTADMSPYKTNVSSSMLLLLIALSAGAMVSAALSLLFSESITKRFRTLAESMKSVEEGNLSFVLPADTGIAEFDQLTLSFNKMTEQLNELVELTREEEAKLAEAERKELEAQLNPHFLFNTLNTIKALARLNGQDEIYTISIKLGKLLRSSLNKNESECTLKESLELAEGYLMIQKIRFKDKISFEINADESVLDIKAPRLILQPLVENAIIHGLEPLTVAGKVVVTIARDGDQILISVKDNGIGFDSSYIENDMENLAKNHHVGLYNTYRRLQMRYSDNLYFKIESKPREGTLVEIRLPIGE